MLGIPGLSHHVTTFQKALVKGGGDELSIKVAGGVAGVAITFFAAMVFGLKPILLVVVLGAGIYALHKYVNKEGFDLSKVFSWTATDKTQDVKKEEAAKATT